MHAVLLEPDPPEQVYADVVAGADVGLAPSRGRRSQHLELGLSATVRAREHVEHLPEAARDLDARDAAARPPR